MVQKIWCETCQDWVSEFRPAYRYRISWALCAACGEGLVMSVEDVLEKNPDREARKTIARLIWDAPV